MRPIPLSRLRACMTRALLCLWTLLPAGMASGQSPAYLWIEGENPSSINIKPNIGGWGRTEFLSGAKWLHISIDAEKVEKDQPAEGVLLRYNLNVARAGRYAVWNRIGYEFVRSEFQWRIDNGKWQTISPETLTTDLMELQEWNEVAWLKMGDQTLSAGLHRLEIRLPRRKDDKGKWQRVLYASDALCLYNGEFLPNGKFKPGQEWRTAQDREAARTMFRLPAPAAPGQRASIALKGLWEVCRDDEQLPGEVARPMTGIPARAYWRAIPVPGDKNQLRPDLIFAHRLWYRTRIQVPPSLIGRSFHIVFPQNNLNTTVYVNGVLCGFNKNPFAKFEIDVTPGIRAGENVIAVGIRDAWYARTANPKEPMKLRRTFNLPIRFFSEGFQDLSYPIWNHPQSGILATPRFVVAGPVRVSDVFCKPSVAQKRLDLEVTLSNPGKTAVSGEVICEAVSARTGKVEKTLPALRFSLPAGAERVFPLRGEWENPTLWWPDDPHLYRLRATVRVGGRPVDISETTFGFREWTTRGKDFLLNGIVWHGWADIFTASSKEEWLAFYRKSNQKMMRFWGVQWQDMPPEEALRFFDENGVVVRRSGMLDGQRIGYMAVENDPVFRKLYNSEIKMDLMKHWKDQMLAQVKGERNHPSIMIWSLENEWLYINCINLHGGLMDLFEREVTVVSDAVRTLDPTRPTMVDGGGATKAQTLPVHGDHYVFDPNNTGYPDLAYEPNIHAGGRGRWQWDQKRPRFLGEDYFANGINPADYAIFGGEDTFLGKTYAHPAAGIIYRMLTEGYRWAEYGAWHFWMGQREAVNQYGSNAWLAVFCREWDWTFGSGQSVRRTFGIFNDTRFSDPVVFTWTLTLGGRQIAQESKEYAIPAGESRKFEATLSLPNVETRTEGELILTLKRRGQEVFRDVKAVSVLPPFRLNAPPGLLVYDPKGAAAAFLKERGVPFTPINSLANLPESGKVLLIGKDALTVTESTSPQLAAYASSGRTVIVLEQQHPLRYQALPAEIEVTAAQGRIAYGEDLNHPALRGLQQKDFFTWGVNRLLYANAYAKPTRGARSLVQCDARLQNTALAEVPVGQGLMLLCQLRVAENLAENATAQKLLANLMEYGAAYRLEYRRAAVAMRDAGNLLATLDAIGLKYQKTADPLTALSAPGVRLAIIPASPANLQQLNDNRRAVEEFTERGGYLILHGLTPEGLSAYNQLVGFEHMIRPFRRERVTFSAPRNPLTSGLTLGDIVMLSGERIFDWTSDEFVASDIFSYVVDFEDVAPFAKFENDFVQMMTNGFVSADAWKYIVNVPAPNAPPLDFKLEFPKPVELTRMEWIGNTFYYPVTRVELFFEGSAAKAAFATEPNNDPQMFDISPPLSGRVLTLRLADWKKLPGVTQVTGLDNIRLFAKRPPEFYQRVRPMLNIGSMMEYPRGSGGIVLCNLLFKESEAVPVNALKKRQILKTLLLNLKAPFSGGRSVIVGTPLQFSPIDISKQANQYRDERGWFGDRSATFKDMPTGRQTFAGVPFDIFTFATSPVPTCIMLGGDGVPNSPAQEVRGIPVQRKADALFFLHTARMDVRRSEQEVRERKRFEMLRYVIHYADGQTAVVPIYAELDIDDYRQRTPTPLPGAQIGWTRPYAGTDLHAVAYLKQWDNPRPEVEIRSIDMVYGPDRRGIPALLAVTAATAAK
jgi:beta-galactosidase